jgi:hypothetical protein
MNSTRTRLRDCFCIACFLLLAFPSVTVAQVRTKKSDRGVYQPPLIAAVETDPDSRSDSRQTKSDIAELVRSQGTPDSTTNRKRRDLVDVTLDVLDTPSPTAKREPKDESPVSDYDAPALKRVAHEEVVLAEPDSPQRSGNESTMKRDQISADELTRWDAGRVVHASGCDGCPDCNSCGCDSIGCDSIGCDSIGCDSIGCDSPSCNAPWYQRWKNPCLCLGTNDWFGSVELLLMFRRGDRLPPLVTTGPDTDPDTAGELGQTGTRVLVGGESILKDITAGGRFTFGTWLDRNHCNSLVFRGWFAGDKEYGFNTNQNVTPVIARPIFNVSDGQPAEQDAFLVAFPGRATGSIGVRAISEIAGGDISIRQKWYSKYCTTIDLLYGYQYMRLNESLAISSTSTSLDDAFAPVDSVISVADAFNAENEFHGGQIGFASRYRERCWSFNTIAKVGFGSLSRRANRSGVTVTSLGGASATDPNGLLVRSTNAGTVTDNTFSWVPELDFSIGWQKYRNLDVTFGYHIIGMTEALQVSGEIDPNLAVNLSNPPTGAQRPSPALRYNSYYVQGIHFGIQHNY